MTDINSLSGSFQTTKKNYMEITLEQISEITGIRVPVLKFAFEMERKLRFNDSKGGCDEAAELYASQFIKKDEQPNTEGIINEYFSSRTPEQIKADYEEFEAQDKINFPNDYEKKDEATTGHLKMIGEAFDASEQIRTGQLKKEVVSSDVEQAAYDCWESESSPTNTEGEKIMFIQGFLQSYKWQSTQQPAIEWLTDDEIDEISRGYGDDAVAQHAMNKLQDLLKDRVNCVDPWISVDDELPPHGINVFCLMKINPSGKNKYRMATGACYDGKWIHSDGSETWFKVSHWMRPLSLPK